jgi:hypothetical protein
MQHYCCVVYGYNLMPGPTLFVWSAALRCFTCSTIIHNLHPSGQGITLDSFCSHGMAAHKQHACMSCCLPTTCQHSCRCALSPRNNSRGMSSSTVTKCVTAATTTEGQPRHALRNML